MGSIATSAARGFSPFKAFAVVAFSFLSLSPLANAQTSDAGNPGQAPIYNGSDYAAVPLFAPPGTETGREATALVIGAIAANLWLDGGVSLSEPAAAFFAAKTDPLRTAPDERFLALIDVLREAPISAPLFVKLVQNEDEEPALRFAWEEDNVAPPNAITFRSALENQCFTLTIPVHGDRLLEAPLELPEGAVGNERQEMRLELIALPSNAYATPVAGDARQVFGVRCQSHTVINATPVAANLLTVGGIFLTSLDSSHL